MKRNTLVLSVVWFVALSALAAPRAMAHCQIPCGIYNDPMRFDMLQEHVTTIEKSMNEIQKLSEEQKPNYNQIVRWVQNKEDHANQFSEIVTYYFLAQRIKPVDPTDRPAFSKYLDQLRQLHEMVVVAMKCKQTTDLENCQKLRSLVEAFRQSYLGKETAHAAHQHPHPHN
jgi:nickel superoxide dismutase